MNTETYSVQKISQNTVPFPLLNSFSFNLTKKLFATICYFYQILIKNKVRNACLYPITALLLIFKVAVSNKFCFVLLTYYFLYPDIIKIMHWKICSVEMDVYGLCWWLKRKFMCRLSFSYSLYNIFIHNVTDQQQKVYKATSYQFLSTRR